MVPSLVIVSKRLSSTLLLVRVTPGSITNVDNNELKPVPSRISQYVPIVKSVSRYTVVGATSSPFMNIKLFLYQNAVELPELSQLLLDGES